VIVDFHSHTYESDGTLSPYDLVARMRARGVRVFSITDHDTLAAYEAIGLEKVPSSLVVGIEINSTYRGSEVHILGYRLPLGSSQFSDLLEANRRARNERAGLMVDQLRAAGYAITMDAVRAEATTRAPLGRPHVGKALVRAGIAEDINAAFSDFLRSGKPGYVPSLFVTPQVAIGAIRQAGGIPVLAHPGRIKDQSIIDELAQSGLEGIEAIYPRHDPEQTDFYRGKAREYDLVVTAGSDFHDPVYNARGVGMAVEDKEIRPFLDLVSAG